MKYLSVICCTLLPLILVSQELRFSSQTGFVIGELKAIKKVMLGTGGSLGIEFFIKHDIYLNTSAGISSLRFECTDTSNVSVFNKKYFLQIPLSLKKYYSLSGTSLVYWDFGLMANYQFSDKKEFRSISGSRIKKQSDLGFSFGAFSIFGFKKKFTNKLSFDIGLSAETDYFFIYKNEQDKIKRDKRMLVISFYRTFDR